MVFADEILPLVPAFGSCAAAFLSASSARCTASFERRARRVFSFADGGGPVLFFMNLGSEKPGFIKFVVYFMLFVLATMNYIWTDSFRLLVLPLTGFGPN
jgi:hypothetical protein